MVRRRLVIGGVIAGGLLLVGLLAAIGGSDGGVPAAASAGSAVTVETAPAVSLARAAVPSASVSAEPRAVSIDDLPPEAKETTPGKSARPGAKPTTKRPAPSKDPFARRR